MARLVTLWLALALCLAAAARTAPDNDAIMNDTVDTAAGRGDALVLIHTTMGDVTVKLYGDTPRHRDNFLKLADEHYYDGVLFHRVIADFMVQTGDPDSREAAAGTALGSGGPGYKVDAEIVCPEHFHRYGALAAAREGDATNPERASSGSQFYIVTGRKFSPGQLAQMEQRARLQMQKDIFDAMTTEHRDSIMAMRRARNQAGLQALQEELVEKSAAETQKRFVPYTPEQIEAYTTVGGTPHLDGTYTVFGEVVEGMDVVDRIQRVQTDGRDRPLEDVRITSTEVLER